MDEINKNGCEKDFGLEKTRLGFMLLDFWTFILKKNVGRKSVPAVWRD